jgi:hypothetical protein
VSSIASIIFHYIRYELLFGEGLPLGLLTSGWSFSQVRYTPFFPTFLLFPIGVVLRADLSVTCGLLNSLAELSPAIPLQASKGGTGCCF